MRNSQVHNMEELLTSCSRSIVEPDMIISEASRIMAILNGTCLEQKFIVEGYETLSVLASGFTQCGYHFFIERYDQKSRINHRESGFANKDDLIQYCEFCVKYGDEYLDEIGNALKTQLEIENRMSRNEICNLNRKVTDAAKEEASAERLNTVQNQLSDLIKLTLLVNALKEFFKDYYQGLN